MALQGKKKETNIIFLCRKAIQESSEEMNKKRKEKNQFLTTQKDYIFAC